MINGMAWCVRASTWAIVLELQGIVCSGSEMVAPERNLHSQRGKVGTERAFFALLVERYGIV